ncbi:tRNA wybutosine-synthesizing protein 4 isoform X1 [Melanerpes formicivorus]|uniref:tRNA wybutosine-synthesizing protein 4 isoform X1 n=1 Tax=Melanerpes formicivorus TaxID=211600 RepID=UPI00358E6C9E
MGRGRPGAPRPAAVQCTGGSSAVSKCSAAARGYIQDRFLPFLVGRQRRRAPLVHRGYYIRARAVDHCIQDFLQRTRGHPRTQILSLGAGFDSLYFRLKDLGLLPHTVVYEVDFPSVVSQKAALIRGVQELVELVGDAGGEPGVMPFSAGDYKLLGADLSQLPELERALEQAGVDREVPTLFIAEVVLAYMASSRSDALLRWAAERFPCAGFLLYEQLGPQDPFGRVMQQHFARRGSALRSLAQYPDCEAQRSRFLARGWSECSAMDMNQFFTCCTPEHEQQRVQALEPFDEYEEWHLKCSHYFVLAASKGMEPPWTPLVPSRTAPGGRGPALAGSVPAACAASCPVPGLRRFGHRSVLLQPGTVLTTGGFGQEEGQHRRARNCQLLLRRAGRWAAGSLRMQSGRWDGRLYHTISCVSKGLALVVGGRTSPSSASLGMLWLKFPESCSAWDPADIRVELVSPKPAVEAAALRWRHSATQVTFQGQQYLFLFGGRSATQPVLGDWHFLHTQELSCSMVRAALHLSLCVTPLCVTLWHFLHTQELSCSVVRAALHLSLLCVTPLCVTLWRFLHTQELSCSVVRAALHLSLCVTPLFVTLLCVTLLCVTLWRFLHTQELSCSMIPVEGPAPEGRHSHSACSWKGGVLVAGGLGAAEQPLGSLCFLEQLEGGFGWQVLETRPPLVPRYSHTAHVHRGRLLLVGGVWLCPSPAPGVTVVDLATGLSLDYAIGTEHLEWPLMLHNHSSVLLPEEEELLLIGGGGNCFSFGTHLNAEPVCLSLRHILPSH